MTKKQKRLLVGALVGAALGLVLAWIAAGDEDPTSKVSLQNASSGDWVKLGITLLGVARQMSDILETV